MKLRRKECGLALTTVLLLAACVARRPAEPVALKYYGYSTARADGKRTAYFLDGDDILEATEGATLKGRYRIERIELNKVLVKDTLETRRQAVPLAQEAKQ
jgi:hypothetical protein